MAISRGVRPLMDGLRPARGSIRLTALRFAIVLASSLPALIAGIAGTASGAARRPYYTDVDGRLPLVHLVRLFREIPSSFVPATIVSVLLAVLADQLLTGGALAVFDPARSPPGERVKVFAAILRDGLTHLWAFLRAASLGLVLSIVGVALIRLSFKKLDIVAYRSGWTGETSGLRLPFFAVLLYLLWVATVGAWVFWCRLITAVDGRTRVFRAGLLVLRVFRRHPLRSWGVFVALTLATTLASGAVLVAWRQSEPRSVGGAVGWSLVWLFTLLLQAFVWLWLLRAGRILYTSDGLADLRGKPDGPLRFFSRLARWRRRAPAKPATSSSATSSPATSSPEAPAPAEP